MKREQILAIEDEVISSLINAGAKARIADMYRQTRQDARRYPSTLILNAIRYYIREGYSTMTKDELYSLYDLKLYNKRNGDINENKSTTTTNEK
tara:strand:- start:343 stop:624 length:282 start_codon:yes stop_codon:yes gene_type:complete